MGIETEQTPAFDFMLKKKSNRCKVVRVGSLYTYLYMIYVHICMDI